VLCCELYGERHTSALGVAFTRQSPSHFAELADGRRFDLEPTKVFLLPQFFRGDFNRHGHATHRDQQTHRPSPLCMGQSSRENPAREYAQTQKAHRKYSEKKPFLLILADCQRESLIHFAPIRSNKLNGQAVLAADRKKILPFRPALS